MYQSNRQSPLFKTLGIIIEVTRWYFMTCIIDESGELDVTIKYLAHLLVLHSNKCNCMSLHVYISVSREKCLKGAGYHIE